MTQRNRSPSTTTLKTLVSPEIKALWQKAADLEGRTLTDFVIASVQEAACNVISQHQNLKLNLKDSEAFVDALILPNRIIP